MIFRRSLVRELTATAIGLFLVLLAILFTNLVLRLLARAAGGAVAPEGILALLGFNALFYLNILLSVTLSTVLFFLFFEMSILPPKPAEWPTWKKVAVHFQYLAYPIVGLVLSVLPALEAHTRLLLGRYLEYRVTEKV